MTDVGGIAALVTAIASLAGLVTFFVSRRDKAKDPLPKTAAEVAIAQGALGVVSDAFGVVNSRLTHLEGEAESLRDEVQMLRREVQSIRSAWAMWYRDLADRWVVHREQPTPPIPPTTD